MEPTPVGKHRTRQRDVIARVIGEARGPLTVSEILRRAQADIPGLGVVTVYRTLKLLRESERIRAVQLPEGEPRYEPTGRAHHHHFHCRRCEQVFDLPGCPLSAAREVAPGFVAESHDVTFYGTCPECVSA